MIDIDKIEISKMSLDDFENIKDILISEFDDFWNEKLLENELKNENSYYVVAKYEEKIVGFAGIKYVLDEADIMNIVVRKDCRNCGVGSFLLKHIVDFAKNNGINKLTLEVNENNIQAIHLYQKFGFRQIAKREKYYNKKDTAIIMQLSST